MTSTEDTLTMEPPPAAIMCSVTARIPRYAPVTTAAEATQIWIDKCALTELVAALSAAVDRADKEAINACYAPQSYDHGGFKGSGSEFAEMICAPTGRAQQLTMHHLLGQSIFDVHGDEAWGETFFVMHALIGDEVAVGYGRYVELPARG